METTGRPAKLYVKDRIDNALIKGDIKNVGKLGIDFVHDNLLERKGSFEGKKYYSAQIIVNVYVANILRQHSRIAIIRRDVQFYYDGRKRCYQCCIDPNPEECIDTEDYDIALAAKSDGDGNFEYFFYDDIIIAEYTKTLKRKRGAYKRDELIGTIEMLSNFTTIYRINLTNEMYDTIYGISGDDSNKTDLSAYDDFFIVDAQKTEEVGKGHIEFFNVKTHAWYMLEQEQALLNEQITRLTSLMETTAQRKTQTDNLLQNEYRRVQHCTELHT